MNRWVVGLASDYKVGGDQLIWSAKFELMISWVGQSGVAKMLHLPISRNLLYLKLLMLLSTSSLTCQVLIGPGVPIPSHLISKEDDKLTASVVTCSFSRWNMELSRLICQSVITGCIPCIRWKYFTTVNMLGSFDKTYMKRSISAHLISQSSITMRLK